MWQTIAKPKSLRIEALEEQLSVTAPVTTTETDVGARIDGPTLAVRAELCPGENDEGENAAVIPGDPVALSAICWLDPFEPVELAVIFAVADCPTPKERLVWSELIVKSGVAAGGGMDTGAGDGELLPPPPQPTSNATM
jgi:hypothetical protein